MHTKLLDAALVQNGDILKGMIMWAIVRYTIAWVLCWTVLCLSWSTFNLFFIVLALYFILWPNLSNLSLLLFPPQYHKKAFIQKMDVILCYKLVARGGIVCVSSPLVKHSNLVVAYSIKCVMPMTYACALSAHSVMVVTLSLWKVVVCWWWHAVPMSCMCECLWVHHACYNSFSPDAFM
jgi:hypothetical protein